MKSLIQSHLDGPIADYLIPDIQRLNGLRPQGAKGLRACAIPTAMFLFVILDFFGFLCRTDSKRPKLSDTKANLRVIFTHPIASFPSDYSLRLDTLVFLFHHGMMHQIFPKACGIRKAGERAPLFETINKDDHLNVDRLSRDVLAMLTSFQTSLSDPRWATLDRQMSDRLKRIQDNDFAEMKHKKTAEQGASGYAPAGASPER